MLKINNLFFLARIQFISDATDLHCLHKSSLLAPDLIPEAKRERLFLTAKGHCSNTSGGCRVLRLSHRARKVPRMKTLLRTREVNMCFSVCPGWGALLDWER